MAPSVPGVLEPAASKVTDSTGLWALQAWCGNTIHWGTRCAPGSAAPPRVSVGFNFLRGGERLQSGAPTLTRATARALGLPERLALIARSILAYSPWYALADSAVPAAFSPEEAERRVPPLS